MQAAPLGEALCQLVNARRECNIARSQVAGDDIVITAESLRFDQVHVIGRIVWQAKGRAVLESLDQQPQPVQRSKADGAAYRVQAARASPVKSALEQRGRGGRIIFAFE